MVVLSMKKESGRSRTPPQYICSGIQQGALRINISHTGREEEGPWELTEIFGSQNFNETQSWDKSRHVVRVIIGTDHVKITSVLCELYPNQWHIHKVSPELCLSYAPAARLKWLRSICNLSDMNKWMKWAIGAISVCYTCGKLIFAKTWNRIISNRM